MHIQIASLVVSAYDSCVTILRINSYILQFIQFARQSQVSASLCHSVGCYESAISLGNSLASSQVSIGCRDAAATLLNFHARRHVSSSCKDTTRILSNILFCAQICCSSSNSAATDCHIISCLQSRNCSLQLATSHIDILRNCIHIISSSYLAAIDIHCALSCLQLDINRIHCSLIIYINIRLLVGDDNIASCLQPICHHYSVFLLIIFACIVGDYQITTYHISSCHSQSIIVLAIATANGYIATSLSNINIYKLVNLATQFNSCSSTCSQIGSIYNIVNFFTNRTISCG